MAVVSPITCEECNTTTHVSHSSANPPPKICHQCVRLLETEKRQRHLAELATLPTEERLRRIEEWIYDYRPPINIRDMRF